MQQPNLSNRSSMNPALLGAAVLLVSVAFTYAYMRLTDLSEQIQQLAEELDSSNAIRSEKDDALAENIDKANAFTLEIARALSTSNQTLEGFQQAVGEISGAVQNLEKLSKTDPELLQKYSRVFFLNEHYMPERLVEIPLNYQYSERSQEQIHALVWPRLQSLLDAASSANVPLYVKSAYRSFEEQQNINSAYSVVYGAGTANQFSAEQGYSEHQLGTTVDFLTTGLNGQFEGFEKTAAYEWLQKNAYQYGFALSYPEHNAYYIFEPWHWRYVGVKLAGDLRSQNKYFYDLEQREIDEYLVNIFD